ncbi:hypothetical protein WA158_007529 [Blastocystis sp. Blastoise]
MKTIIFLESKQNVSISEINFSQKSLCNTDKDDSISKESINIQTITVDKTSESINHVESIPVPGNIPPLEKESIELPKNNKNDKSTLLFEKETIYKYIEDVNNLSSPNRISDKDTLSKITNNSSKDDSTNSIPVIGKKIPIGQFLENSFDWLLYTRVCTHNSSKLTGS